MGIRHLVVPVRGAIFKFPGTCPAGLRFVVLRLLPVNPVPVLPSGCFAPFLSSASPLAFTGLTSLLPAKPSFIRSRFA